MRSAAKSCEKLLRRPKSRAPPRVGCVHSVPCFPRCFEYCRVSSDCCSEFDCDPHLVEFQKHGLDKLPPLRGLRVTARQEATGERVAQFHRCFISTMHISIISHVQKSVKDSLLVSVDVRDRKST